MSRRFSLLLPILLCVGSACTSSSQPKTPEVKVHDSAEARRSEPVTGVDSSHSEPHDDAVSDTPSASVTELTGQVTSAGQVSRGKTMASWNGIPLGSHYLIVKLDAPPPGTPESVFVQLPEKPQGEPLEGEHIRIRGSWRYPKASPPPDLKNPRQMPIDESGKRIDPEPIFVATEVSTAVQ